MLALVTGMLLMALCFGADVPSLPCDVLGTMRSPDAGVTCRYSPDSAANSIIAIGEVPEYLDQNCTCASPPYVVKQKVMVSGGISRRQGNASAAAYNDTQLENGTSLAPRPFVESEDEAHAHESTTSPPPSTRPFVDSGDDAYAHEFTTPPPPEDGFNDTEPAIQTYPLFVAIPAQSCCCSDLYMRCAWTCDDIVESMGLDSGRQGTCLPVVSTKTAPGEQAERASRDVVIDVVLFSCVISCFAAAFYFERSRRAAIYHRVPPSDETRRVPEDDA